MENETNNSNEFTASHPKTVQEEKPCEPKKNRNCLNLTLSIISIVGVIVLFVLYFTGQSGSKPSNRMSSKMNFSIAYVNIDTLMEDYELVKTMKETFQAKQTKASDSLEKLQRAYEYQVLDYQKKMKANAYSIEQATNIEKGLYKQQEDLYTLKDELTSQLADENLEMTTLLQDSITNFLKRYNTQYNFDYIFSYSQSSEILFANDSLDITKEVLEELNKEYKETGK